MIYVMSDLHGCIMEFLEMLKLINFNQNDTLYILGDVIDRGLYGIDLLKYIKEKNNIHLLKGNHELMMQNYIEQHGTKNIFNYYNVWGHNGGESTFRQYIKLPKGEQTAIFKYIKGLPAYFLVSVGDSNYLLTHAGLTNYIGCNDLKSLIEYNENTERIFWDRENIFDKINFDIIIIHGHTPVQYFFDVVKPKIVKYSDQKIDIDCGCVYDRGRLACLCLDNMKAFYV